MRITVIAEPWIVPPLFYGGIERMCHLLCNGLASKGHSVNLLSSSHSKGYNALSFGYRAPTTSFLDRAVCRINFSAKSFALSWNADVIYSFKFWPEYHTLINKIKVPVIYCQQNSAKENDLIRVINAKPSRGYMQAVSRDQISKLDIPDRNKLFIIHNAVNTDVIAPVVKPNSSYLAYLGRLNYDKGIDIAVKISLATGVPLKIAGVLRPHERAAQRLFEESILPYLGNHVQFIGPITDQQKSSFLGNAIALLMPNRWREPFGITMAEALAAGTPVIGTNIGSIPEVIDNNISGYVCDSFDELCNAVYQLNALKRETCREIALQRYSHSVYINSILSMFYHTLS